MSSRESEWIWLDRWYGWTNSYKCDGIWSFAFEAAHRFIKPPPPPKEIISCHRHLRHPRHHVTFRSLISLALLGYVRRWKGRTPPLLKQTTDGSWTGITRLWWVRSSRIGVVGLGVSNSVVLWGFGRQISRWFTFVPYWCPVSFAHLSIELCEAIEN